MVITPYMCLEPWRQKELNGLDMSFNFPDLLYYVRAQSRAKALKKYTERGALSTLLDLPSDIQRFFETYEEARIYVALD